MWACPVLIPVNAFGLKIVITPNTSSELHIGGLEPPRLALRSSTFHSPLLDPSHLPRWPKIDGCNLVRFMLTSILHPTALALWQPRKSSRGDRPPGRQPDATAARFATHFHQILPPRCAKIGGENCAHLGTLKHRVACSVAAATEHVRERAHTALAARAWHTR
jgi:hypothetical protein